MRAVEPVTGSRRGNGRVIGAGVQSIVTSSSD
jgi:hypothetical protein